MNTGTTEENLKTAFVGEAKACLRLLGYAEKAEQEGYPQMARLFRAISAAEKIHALKHLRRMKVIKSTEENLKAAFESETTVSENIYPDFIRVAEEEGQEAARVGFSHARDAESFHAKLYKNAIDHMKHWDKNSGILIKMGDVIHIENAETDAEGVEKSQRPMPDSYPGEDRISALETLVPAEESLIAKYEKLIPMIPDGEIHDQLQLHLALDREHLFTQNWLLTNAKKIKGLV